MSKEKTEPEVVDEAPQMDAVIVVKTKQDDGTISTEVMVNGNVELTEVQTLLELAVRGWRKRIGLVD